MKLPNAKTVEGWSNVAVIVAVVIFIAWFAENHFATKRLPIPKANLVGKHIALSSVIRPPARENVLLGLSTVCHFCQMNTDLYKHLAEMDAPGRVSVVAVIPQSEAEAKQYLAKDGLQAGLVAGTPLSNFHISGTPTILLVDSTGVIRKAWVGALDPAQQRDVISSVRNGL